MAVQRAERDLEQLERGVRSLGASEPSLADFFAEADEPGAAALPPRRITL